MEEILFIGQWQVFFKYGKEYGEYVDGNEVEFRLFIEQYSKNAFVGRAIDWEGIGANGEVSVIKGFIDGNLISFIKQYNTYLELDESGASKEHDDEAPTIVTYEGLFNRATNSFTGRWEISRDIAPVGENWIEEVITGTWRMKKEEQELNSLI